MHFDPKVAYTHRFAWEEVQRLWQEGIDRNDESIATAAAGTMLYACYALYGGLYLHTTLYDRPFVLTFIAVCTSLLRGHYGRNVTNATTLFDQRKDSTNQNFPARQTGQQGAVSRPADPSQ